MAFRRAAEYPQRQPRTVGKPVAGRQSVWFSRLLSGLLWSGLLLSGSALASRPCAAETQPPVTIVVDQQSSYDSCQVIEMRIAQYILVERLQQAYRCDSLPWIRAQLLVKSGERDAMVTIPTDERRQYADPSTLPVVTLNMRLFVANNSPRYRELINAKTLADLHGGTFIAQAGSGWAKKQIQPRQIAIEWAGNIENVFRMLKTRRGDFTIQGDIYALPILKALAFEDYITMSPVIFDRADFHFMLSKRSARRDLLSRFDAELNAMTADGTLAIVTQQAMQAISAEMSAKHQQ